jgi:hypothetical protein
MYYGVPIFIGELFAAPGTTLPPVESGSSVRVCGRVTDVSLSSDRITISADGEEYSLLVDTSLLGAKDSFLINTWHMFVGTLHKPTLALQWSLAARVSILMRDFDYELYKESMLITRRFLANPMARSS